MKPMSSLQTYISLEAEDELDAEGEALAARRRLGQQDVLGGQRGRVGDDQSPSSSWNVILRSPIFKDF